MRRLIAFGAVAALAAWVVAQTSGGTMLDAYAKALNGAKSLSTTYTVQKIGGTASTYSLDLAKPNKARIDTPTQLIVADGTNITILDKHDQTYYKKPETDGDLKDFFKSDDLLMFGAFFDADFLKNKVVSSKTAGQKTRKGVNYNVVVANMDDKGKKTVSFYLDPADQLAKVGEFVLNDAGATDTLLVMTKDFSANSGQGANVFAFTAPEGAKEISLDEINAGKWYTNLEEAESMAKKLNKPLFVDFYADW